jgi:phospholipid/cholesterol/gamma-HCH transport system substrate-binding protein/paraquat-inducible protein B
MEKRKPYVRLIISLEQNIFEGSKTPEKTLLEREVERGLRVRMASVGLTGTSYIELDYLDPGLHPPLEMDWTPENGYIPSAGSSFTRIVSSAEEVFRKLENVDILGLVDNVNGLFKVAKDKLETTDLASLSGNLDQLLKELRVTNQEIQTMIKDLDLPQISKETQKALNSMQSLFNDPKLMSTIDELHTALENLNQMTGGNQGRIGLVLDNLRILTDNLKTITDNAKNYPSQLLFGAPPPTRKP